MQRPQKETATIEDIIITEELSRRNPRPANLLKENQALHALVRQLVNQPQTMLQILVDIALELCSAGTAGISLLEITPTGEEAFRWNVLAGALKHYLGGNIPREFSPCGVCLKRGTPQLYSYPERCFTYLQAANTPIVEGLVLPFQADNHTLGTIWIMSHDEQRHFDSEDVRVMTSLADFAAAALLVNQRQTQQLLAANVRLETEVKERQLAEESAQENEAYFRAIADLVPDLLWRNDLDGKTIWYNKRWLEYTGQTLEEAQGDGWINVIHPSDRASSLANFQNAVKECRPLRQEHRIKGKDGNYRWFLAQARPVIVPDGQIIWVGAATDIHDQRMAFLALQDSETRLRAMIENLPGGAAFIVDSNLRYLLAEGEALSAAGFKPQDLVGKTIFEVLAPELAAKYEELYRQALAGEPFTHEHNAHGSWYISRGTPLRTKSGEVSAVLAVSYNISERKKAEVALRESEEKYRSLFQSMDQGYAVVEVLADDNGEWNDFLFLEVNPAFERQTAMSNAVGRKATEILGTPNPAWAKIYGRVAQTGEPVRFEEKEETLDRIFDLYAFRLGEAGSRCVAVLFTDITERKRHDANLAFLAEVSQDLARLTNIDETMNALGEKIGRHFDLSACAFAELYGSAGIAVIDHNWHRSDVPSLRGTYRMQEFLTPEVMQLCLAGEDIVIRDVFDDPLTNGEQYATLNIGSFLSIPLIRNGEWQFLLVIYRSEPHDWRDDEIELTRELANRIWTRLERARAEVGLRQSEMKYRSLFDSIDEGYALCEVMYDENERPVDVRYLEVNPAFEQLSGLENVAGKTAMELMPIVESFWLETFAQVIRTGEATRIEEYIEGLNRWLDVYFSRVGGEGSRQIAVVFNDITERKQTEEQLRHAAELDAFRVKLSDALRSLSDPVEIQRAAMRVLGEHLAAERVCYGELTDDGEMIVIADNYLCSDAIKFIGQVPISAYGKVSENLRAGHAFVFSDLDRDERLSDAEREAIRALSVISSATVPLVKQSRWVSNLAVHYSKPHQWTDDEIQLLQETADRTWEAVNRARAEDALRDSEIQRIQEQVAREEERQRAEALAELDRAKTLFFSNVSHEFRTPLTLLLAPLQDALSDSTYPLLPPHRDRLQLAHRNAMRLLKLVNTLLDFSRIEAGRMEAVYEPTDLAMFTTQLASVFRSAIERAGLRLIVDCPPLPQPVYVDREMWEKIVLNLLSNAFKFTLEGEISVGLHHADDHYVTLQIQDTGTGIEPQQLPHIFERFYQVRGAKARTLEGSGIGLALVQELIKLHFGTIDVTSTLGVGSCFTVTIPLGTAHLPSEHTTATRTLTSTALGAEPYVQEAERWLPEGQIWGSGGSRGSRGSEELTITNSLSPPASPDPPAHILLVDDNADMRDYLTQILSEHVTVEAVAHGEAALAAATQRVPDLVLSDVMMPGLDGFGLLKALRADARTKEVPIILLSARAGEESIIEGLEAGADDYLIKPFSATELVTRVNAHLQMAQLRSQALQQERTINRRKDEVLSVVSHELNTPLVAILGWTRLLRSNSPSPAILSKGLETIERNATLQAKLVEDLLHISRITAGKISLNQEPVQLQEVIENAIATVRQSLETKEIRLEWTLEPAPVTVGGDLHRLQQIILNLLTNAVKFTPNGGRIEVSLATDENQAQFVISDTGCGIDAELLPYIFDTFRQAPTSKKGLGLGLAIARSLVQLHGGTISAHSQGVGQGATFIVKLPLIYSCSHID